MSERRVLILWLVFSVCLAGFVSPHVSKLPDGLEKIAGDLGFIDTEKTAIRAPLDDYSWEHGSVAGELSFSPPAVIGTAIVLAAAILISGLVTKRPSKY